jgi:hypothetical protein
MIHIFFHEYYETDYITKFKTIIKSDIKKVIIYCEKNREDLNYKIIITDKNIINELKEASTIDYGTKIYSGQYNQFYSIQVETKNGEKYMYGFNKSFSPQNNPCRKSLKYKGKIYPNPYNDCGQLGIYHNPYLSEYDLIENPYQNTKVAAYNLKLINILEKYADNMPFDGKNKVPFYNRFELREMKKKNQINN